VVPNLFIIGAMKSGTTSLHQYLSRHPDAFMSEPKEPGFFVEELAWSRGWGWYLNLFARAGEAQIVGESSTHYAKLPTYGGVADRIRRFNPHARFVYVMRDPLDRIVSHYWHNVRNLHLEAERRPFARAILEDPAYLAYSDYAMQIEPYLQLFGRERLFVLTFESLMAEPQVVVGHLCGWLGIADAIPPEVFSARWNGRPDVLSKARGTGLLNRLRHSRLWDLAAPLIPKRVRQVGAGMAEERVAPDAEQVREGLLRVRPRVQKRAAALTELLGRPFPEWTTLNAHD
jgi:hypothetical protein